MDKIDFKKELKRLYNPSKTDFQIVAVPEMQYLMVDGHGDPNVAQEYQDAVETLYAVAYKVKFASKKELKRDYVVPPLEGLWWAEDMESFTTKRNKSAWDWTMMIMQPEWITQDIFGTARGVVESQKDLTALTKLRLETYCEGLAVQILHIGSYEDEAPTLHKMHTMFIPQNGFELQGKHHEIYLSDPRKVAPEKLKTILRQPVKKVST